MNADQQIIWLETALSDYQGRIKGEGVWSSMAPFLKEKGPNENVIIKKISTMENELYYKIEEFFKAKRE